MFAWLDVMARISTMPYLMSKEMVVSRYWHKVIRDLVVSFVSSEAGKSNLGFGGIMMVLEL